MSQESNAGVFHRIGAPVFPIAAEHGTGVDDLLDAALAKFYPAAAFPSPVGAQHAAPSSPTSESFASVEEEKLPDVIEVAIIVRPNLRKPTLLNRLLTSAPSTTPP